MRLKEAIRRLAFPEEYARVDKSASDSVRNWKELAEFLGLDSDSNPDAMGEATYYACMKVLREGVSKMPMRLMRDTGGSGIVEATEHPAYYRILRRPNRFMTASAFWATVEQCRNHFGNAYVLMRGYGTKHDPIEFWPMPNDEVDVWYDNTMRFCDVPDLYYRWSHGGNMLVAKSDEVLHFKSTDTFDGIMGVPVIDRLAGEVGGAIEAQRFQSRMIASGMAGKSVLQYTGEISESSARVFASNIDKYIRGDYAEDGVKQLIPIPIGTQLTPLNMKLTDAQFIELKKYSSIQIASAFGIKPQQIGDMTKTSYASSQAQQEAFYTDTMLAILKSYEEELTCKALTEQEVMDGFFFEFDTSSVLKASFETQVSTLKNAVECFLMTPNEARRSLKLPSDPSGDVLVGNGNLIPLSMVGSQWNATESEGGEI